MRTKTKNTKQYKSPNSSVYSKFLNIKTYTNKLHISERVILRYPLDTFPLTNNMETAKRVAEFVGLRGIADVEGHIASNVDKKLKTEGYLTITDIENKSLAILDKAGDDYIVSPLVSAIETIEDIVLPKRAKPDIIVPLESQVLDTKYVVDISESQRRQEAKRRRKDRVNTTSLQQMFGDNADEARGFEVVDPSDVGIHTTVVHHDEIPGTPGTRYQEPYRSGDLLARTYADKYGGGGNPTHYPAPPDPGTFGTGPPPSTYQATGSWVPVQTGWDTGDPNSVGSSAYQTWAWAPFHYNTAVPGQAGWDESTTVSSRKEYDNAVLKDLKTYRFKRLIDITQLSSETYEGCVTANDHGIYIRGDDDFANGGYTDCVYGTLKAKCRLDNLYYTGGVLDPTYFSTIFEFWRITTITMHWRPLHGANAQVSTNAQALGASEGGCLMMFNNNPFAIPAVTDINDFAQWAMFKSHADLPPINALEFQDISFLPIQLSSLETGLHGATDYITWNTTTDIDGSPSSAFIDLGNIFIKNKCPGLGAAYAPYFYVDISWSLDIEFKGVK